MRNARSTLLAGFTTVRDVGTYRALVDAALRDAIDDGTVIGPRMAVAGAYVTVTSGGGELVGAAHDVTIPAEYRFGVANGVDEVRERVRAILNGGADFIKIIATGAVLTQGTKPGASEYTEEEIRAAVEQAAEYGTYVAAHAHGAEGIKRAVRAGVRSIEHGSLIDDEGIALMKEQGTWLVADIYNGDYIASVGQGAGVGRRRSSGRTTRPPRPSGPGFRKAVAAGVKIAYGTDSGVYPHRFVARQLPYMVRYGMTPMQAIQSATLSAAAAHGVGGPGRLAGRRQVADIIAVEGDALADLQALREGRVRHEGWRRLQGAVIDRQANIHHRGTEDTEARRTTRMLFFVTSVPRASVVNSREGRLRTRVGLRVLFACTDDSPPSGRWRRRTCSGSGR